MKNLIFIILSIIFLGCSSETVPDLLSPFIIKELKKDNGVIEIAKFEGVKWDKLYVVTAYQTDRYFDDNLLRYKDEIYQTGINHDEGFNLLLLFNGDSLVSLSKIYSQDISFAGAYNQKNNIIMPYAKRFANFWYKKSASGDLYIPTNDKGLKN